MSSTLPPESDAYSLLNTLATLRVVIPAVLLGVLIVRFVSKGFLSMMGRIQAQGWTPGPDDDMFAPIVTPVDEIHPVVVKVTSKRRGLILGSFSLVALTYFGEGATQIIASLISHTWTPDLPIFKNIIPYSVGGVASFALCAIAMSSEERFSKKPGEWGAIYPRMVTFLSIVGELPTAGIMARILQTDANQAPSNTILPSIDFGFTSLRILLLAFLFLSQTPILYKSKFVPWESLDAPDTAGTTENTSLLGANANGSANYGSGDGGKKKHILRSSRPPTNRPPDMKSLSILTLFSRVRTLFPYLWPSKSFALQVLALICFGLMLLKRVVNVGVPIFFGRIISDLSAGRPPYVSIGLYVGASFLQDSNTMLYRYLWLPVEQYSEREMTSLSFDCLLNLSLKYHTHRKTGELLRILDRADAINSFFETLIFTFIPILIDLPVAVLVLSIRYGAVITSVVIMVSVVFVTTSITLAESRTKLYRGLRDQNVFMAQVKQDTLSCYEVVKVFTAESFESQRLRTAMRVYQKGYFRVYSSWNSLSLIQDSISAFGLLLCSFILARRVVNGEMDVGDYVTFVSYLGQLYSPLNRIASLYKTVMQNLVDTEQLMELLSSEKDVVDQPGAEDLVLREDGKGDIVFDDVKFSYDGRQDTIKGISFRIKAGQSVALVGPSGGGKSTIMRLLYRFYDVTEGSISINGADIRNITQHSLRKNIGLVPQDTVLFNETCRYNIGYGNHEASEEEIIEAAKAASIHDRILSFPDQYETRVGERGQRLSGGEKQRVAIARVVLKNPPILLLDEATSALDTTNERAIQQRLRELSQGRTTLAIAHRLSTIIDCDVIHVLDEGRIAESGGHHELLGKGGIYAELWQKQIQSEAEALLGVPVPASGTGSANP